MRIRKSGRAAIIASLFIAGLAACGGGGGGGGSSSPPAPTLSIGTTLYNFTADHPASPFPADQVVSATVTNVSAGTLYFLVTVGNPQVVSVSNPVITGSTSGQATLSVPSPARLGMGTHSSTVQIRACLNSANCATGELTGSPQTVTVNYRIGSPVQRDTMMPAVAIANTPGRTILRGSGFANVTGVRFAGVNATAVTVVNDTELHVEYPAMTAAGPLAITLQKGATNTNFGAALTVVDPIDFTATTLVVPPTAGIRHIPVGVSFDAVHSALLIGMRTIEDGPIAPPYTPANDVILRYAYTGSAWQAPTVRSFPRLRSTALSPDGQVLLAANDDAIDQLDAVTFISTGSSAKPVETNEYIRTLAFTNDGNVVVATGYKNGSGSTRLYLYSMRDASFVYPRLLGSGQFGVNLFYYAQLGVSGDGSVALLGEPGSGGGRPITQYQAATGKWVDSATRYNYYAGNATTNGWAPALNERGTRSVVSAAVAFGNDSMLRSLDSDLEPSGALMNASEGVLLSADGNRAYVLERIWGTPNVCSIRAFDLTVPPAQATSTYSEITTGGFPIARSCLWAVNSDPIGILSPDGRTMFIAGAEGVSVIPLP